MDKPSYLKPVLIGAYVILNLKALKEHSRDLIYFKGDYLEKSDRLTLLTLILFIFSYWTMTLQDQGSG